MSGFVTCPLISLRPCCMLDAVCLSPCTGFTGDKRIRVVVTDTKKVVKQKTKRRAICSRIHRVCVSSFACVCAGSFYVYPFPFFS
jgi:hypothetical protein